MASSYGASITVSKGHTLYLNPDSFITAMALSTRSYGCLFSAVGNTCIARLIVLFVIVINGIIVIKFIKIISYIVLIQLIERLLHFCLNKLINFFNGESFYIGYQEIFAENISKLINFTDNVFKKSGYIGLHRNQACKEKIRFLEFIFLQFGIFFFKLIGEFFTDKGFLDIGIFAIQITMQKDNKIAQFVTFSSHTT